MAARIICGNASRNPSIVPIDLDAHPLVCSCASAPAWGDALGDRGPEGRHRPDAGPTMPAEIELEMKERITFANSSILLALLKAGTRMDDVGPHDAEYEVSRHRSDMPTVWQGERL